MMQQDYKSKGVSQHSTWHLVLNPIILFLNCAGS